MKLPRALAPWARQLQIFPDEISLALGAMARALEPFVAPLRSAEEISNREPNGYDGVTRRGIYERLLLSELAFADEMPEEFVRRAAMGEHLFLNLARVAPAAKRISVALFDAGSDQAGTPRVAHLAALIVLARRAESVKANFSWGVLQDAELKTFAEVTESNVLNLLAARTAHNATAEYVEKWREKLNELESGADVWLVGAPDLKDFEAAKGFSVLSIEDVLVPNARQLQISVESASGAAVKETVLELPEASVCTRLLRNPFEIYAPPEPTNLAGNLSGFFFDDNGGKIFARSGGDAKSVLYISVPNSPNADAGSPRRYRSSRDNEILLAAGRLGKSVATVSLGESGHLRLDYPKFGNFKLPAGSYSVKNFDFVLPNDDKTLLPIFNLRYPNSPFYRAAMLDAKNNLIVFHEADGDDKNCVGNAALMAVDVLAAARLEKRFAYVGRNTSTNTMEIFSYGEKPEKRELPFAEVTRAFFGRATAQTADKIFGLLALGDAENHFAILTASGEKYIDATLGSTVVGVFQDASFSPEVGLVELEENRRTLNFNTGGKYNKQIFTAGEEIVKIVFSHRSPVCAYKTERGKVVIFSLTHRVPIGTVGG